MGRAAHRKLPGEHVGTDGRLKVVAAGNDELLATVVEVGHRIGARSLEIGWSHPEYPDDYDGNPPAGVPVTWYVQAVLADGCTVRGEHNDHRHQYAMGRAAAEFLRKLGATVTLIDFVESDL